MEMETSFPLASLSLSYSHFLVLSYSLSFFCVVPPPSIHPFMMLVSPLATLTAGRLCAVDGHGMTSSMVRICFLLAGFVGRATTKL